MKHSLKRLVELCFVFSLLTLAVAAATNIAPPSQVRITGTLIRVDYPGSDEASLFLRTSSGEMLIPVRWNAAVRDADGQPRDLLALGIGQEVELRGDFSKDSMIVQEVRILHTGLDEGIRIGEIQSLRQEGGVTSFLLDGMEVFASPYNTVVLGNTAEDGLPQLQEGRRVRVRGRLMQDHFVASSIRPLDLNRGGTRFEIEGVVESANSSGFNLTVGGADQKIEVARSSADSKLPATGTTVKVTGDFGLDDRLHAQAISATDPAAKMAQLMLTPTMLRLSPGATGILELSVRPRQTIDLEVSLSAVVPNVIATMPASVKIPQNADSVKVSITAGTADGMTLVVAAPVGMQSVRRAGAIVAVEDALGQQTPEATFRPEKLKLKVNDKGELLLFLTPSANKPVTFTLKSSDNAIFTCDGSVTIAAGSPSALIKVTAGATVGKAMLTATATLATAGLIEADIALAAKAEIEVVADPAARIPEADFRPDDLKLKVSSSGELMLHLNPPADKDVTFTLESGDPLLFTCVGSVTIAAGKSFELVKITSLARIGKAILTATGKLAAAAGSTAADIPLKALAEIEVVGDPGIQKPQAAFRPDDLKLRVNDHGELMLFLTPPFSKPVTFTLVSSDTNIFNCDGTVTVEQGKSSALVKVNSLGAIGKASLTATGILPAASLTEADVTLTAIAQIEVLADPALRPPEAAFRPDSLKLMVNGSGDLMLFLMPPAKQDVTFTLTSNATLFTFPVSVKIAAGDASAQVKLTAGAATGKALLTATATLPAAGLAEANVTLTAKAEIEIVADPTTPHPEVSFRPDSLKLKVNSSGELTLFLTPAAANDITFSLESSDTSIFTCDGSVLIGKGKQSAQVMVKSLAKIGQAWLTATVKPAAAGPSGTGIPLKAKAEIEVDNDSAIPHPEAVFRPHKLQLKPNSSGELMLFLTQPVDQDLKFDLFSGNPEIFTCPVKSVTILKGQLGVPVKVITLAKSGNAMLTATATLTTPGSTSTTLSAKADIQVISMGDR